MMVYPPVSYNYIYPFSMEVGVVHMSGIKMAIS
jgi:hypothetical protein